VDLEEIKEKEESRNDTRGASEFVLFTSYWGDYIQIGLPMVKGKVFPPIHAITAYRQSKGIAPLILNLGTGWR